MVLEKIPPTVNITTDNHAYSGAHTLEKALRVQVHYKHGSYIQSVYCWMLTLCIEM